MTRLNVGKPEYFPLSNELGLRGALILVMYTYDSIYKKMASSPEQGGAGHLPEPAQTVNPSRQISSAVAHDLNNLLTVVQVYADRLLLQQEQNPDMQPQLKRILEASKRAANIVRDASPQNVTAVAGAAGSKSSAAAAPSGLVSFSI